MGSVQSKIGCPRCKSEECFEDFYYKTGEEYVSCPDCGFHRSFFFKRDTQGNLIKKDPTRGYEFDNLIGEEKHLPEPYGSYHIEAKKGGGQFGTLETEADYKKFVLDIAALRDKPNTIKEVIISRFVDGEIKKEKL